MRRWTALIPVVAVTILLAACGDDSMNSPVAPETPSFDGGYVVGGNRIEPEPSLTPDEGATTHTAEAAGDTTGRGGYVVGGN